MNINISINNKVATVSGSPVIICGNSDYSVTFTFDSEWANLPTKQARFSWYLNGEKQFTDVTFTGNTVAVPTLSDITALYVGVFAGDLHTTTPAKIICLYSALCGSGTKMLKGETGDAATIDVGTVETGAPGSKAEVTNVGTRGAAVLNFKIPAGSQGADGQPGANGLNALYRHMISLYDPDDTDRQAGYLFIVTNGATPFTVKHNSFTNNYEIEMGEDSTFILAARWYDNTYDCTFSLLLNTTTDDLVPDLLNVGYMLRNGNFACITLSDFLNENSTDTVAALPSVAIATTLNTEV